jgi:hypothetical protein
MSGGPNPFGKLFGGLGKGPAFGGAPEPTVGDFTKRPLHTVKRGPQHPGMGRKGSNITITNPSAPKQYNKAGHLEAQKQWQFKEDMRNRKLAKMKELMDYGAKDLNPKMTTGRNSSTPEARSLVDSPMMPPNPAIDLMDPEVKSARDRERKRYGRRYG